MGHDELATHTTLIQAVAQACLEEDEGPKPLLRLYEQGDCIIDCKGRTTAERIAAVHRHGDPVTDQQREDARRLLDALLRAAQPFGVSLCDFDWVADLPGACLDVVLAKTQRELELDD